MQLELNLILFFKIKDRKNQFLNMQLLILKKKKKKKVDKCNSYLTYCLMGKDKANS